MSGRILVGVARSAGEPRWLVIAAALALSAWASGCSEPRDTIDLPDASLTADGSVTRDSGPGTFPDSAIANTSLAVERVAPGHGPFVGGSQVVLRGSGFTTKAQVTIGGRAVQPDEHELIDSRRLSVLAPAGEVGPADVTVTVGDTTVTLEDGYVYDAIYVDPPRGSTSGNTYVTITGNGTAFAEGDTVLFGRSPCTDVQVVSETRITCRTPPAAGGSVDVVVHHASDDSDITATDGYSYYDTSDPISGGLGGGPIAGALHVTVINTFTGNPMEGAFAVLGNDLTTQHRGVTNALGQITFSGPDVVGPATVHVSAKCHTNVSFVAFDASDVTIFLSPWQNLPDECLPPPQPPPSSMGGRGRNLAFVGGELIWRGTNEYGPNPWRNIPEARPGWERVAYVYTTVREIGVPNPNPAYGGVQQRVLEVVPQDGREHLGYPYQILAFPRGLAVYAIAGLQEKRADGRFIPYVMGVARNVLPGPGDSLSGVDIVMDIPLDHYVQVELGELPASTPTGPDRFRVQTFLDLGGEGLVRRQIAGADYDTIRRLDTAQSIRFVTQPALGGTIANARYRVTAGWYTGPSDRMPYTFTILNGVTAVDEAVQMPDFMGIPQATLPAIGQPIPGERVLRWTADGPPPDMHWVTVTGADGNLAWEMFAPGSVSEVPVPDLSSVPTLRDIPEGRVDWRVRAMRIPSFEFDTFSYRHLGERYWTHGSANEFRAQR